MNSLPIAASRSHETETENDPAMEEVDHVVASETLISNHPTSTLRINDDNHVNDTTATPPSTPTKELALEKQMEEEFGRTPQISADLFQRFNKFNKKKIFLNKIINTFS